MREVSTDEITKNIKEMCIEANYILSDDVKNKIFGSSRKFRNWKKNIEPA